MSVQERFPRYAVSSPHKPVCDMTPEEWATYKHEMDARAVIEGLPPLDWDLVGEPLPITDEVREKVLAMKLPGE